MKEDQVKQQIISASKAVFKKLEYDKVTMDHIAKAAGKGRSTLYYYFKNKHEVFEIMATSEHLGIIKTAMDAVHPDKTIEQNLFHYYERKLNTLINEVKEFPFLMEDMRKHPDLTYKIYHRLRYQEIEIFEKVLTWALEKKEIAPIYKKDLEFLAMAMVTCANSLEKEMLLYGAIDKMSSRLQWIANLLIKGLKYDNSLN